MVSFNRVYGISMVNFESKVASRLMDFFFLNPGVKRYINELAKMLDLDPKNTYRKLVELEKEGLLGSEIRGKEKFYFLNRKYPLLKEYRNIFMKTAGVEKKIREALLTVEGIEQAYIYGSYASNRMDAASDLDILVVGGHSVMALQKAIDGLQKYFGREINAVNMSSADFDGKMKLKEPFLVKVMSGSLIRLI
jgi:predicted nucleotidyltransferase